MKTLLFFVLSLLLSYYTLLADASQEKDSAPRHRIFQETTSVANSINLEQLRLEEEKKQIEDFFLESKRNKAIIHGLLAALLINICLGTMFYLRLRRKKIVYRSMTLLDKEIDTPVERKYKPGDIMANRKPYAAQNSIPPQVSLELKDFLALHIVNDRSWGDFKVLFSQDFPNFYDDLKASSIPFSEGDLRLLSLVYLNLSNRDLADKLSISVDGIKKAKQRLKKKIADYENCSLTALH